MHFVDAKGILSAKNGMNLYRGCTHGVSTVIVVVNVITSPMISRILR